MNRDVTQRLLKDSIICLCRNHISATGDENGLGFEIDGLICISQSDGERQTVFKIHELINGISEMSGTEDNKRYNPASHIHTRNENEKRPANYGQSFRNSFTSNGYDLFDMTHSAILPSPVGSYPITRHSSNLDEIASMASGRKRKGNWPRSHETTPLVRRCHGVGVSEHTEQSSATDRDYELEEANIVRLQIKSEPAWQSKDNEDVTIPGEARQCNNESVSVDVVKDHGVESSMCNNTGKELFSVSSISDVRTQEFLCTHCSVTMCCSVAEIEAHVKEVHGVLDAFFCLPCFLAFSNETDYIEHSKSSSCRALQTTESAGLEPDCAAAVDSSCIAETTQKDCFKNTAALELSQNSTCRVDDVMNKTKQHRKNASECSAQNEQSDTCIIDETQNLDENKSYACIECSMEFVDFPALNIHSMITHDLYPCPYCQRLFTLESQRELHLYEHTGESPSEGVSHSGSANGFVRDGLVPAVGRSPADSSEEELHSNCSSLAGTDMRDERFVNDWGPLRSPLNRARNNGLNPTVVRSARVIDRFSHSAAALPTIEISDDEDLGAAIAATGALNYCEASGPHYLDLWRTFTCEICREPVTGVESYTEHCSVYHRRTPCPYCGATFTQKASMERHRRQHTGEKPYKCSLCEQSFTRKESLMTHVARAHPKGFFSMY